MMTRLIITLNSLDTHDHADVQCHHALVVGRAKGGGGLLNAFVNCQPNVGVPLNSMEPHAPVNK